MVRQDIDFGPYGCGELKIGMVGWLRLRSASRCKRFCLGIGMVREDIDFGPYRCGELKIGMVGWLRLRSASRCKRLCLGIGMLREDIGFGPYGFFLIKLRSVMTSSCKGCPYRCVFIAGE